MLTMAMTSPWTTALVAVLVLHQTAPFVRAQFQTEPRDAEVLLNGLVLMRCTTVDVDATVYWSVPGGPRMLSVGPNREFTGGVPTRFSLHGEEGTGEYNLMITEVVAEDAGQYICNIVVPNRGDTSQIILSTEPATLSIVQLPANGNPTCWIREGRIVDVGDQLSLRCGSSDLTIELTWYVEDVALSKTEFQITSAPLGLGIDSPFWAQGSADQKTFTCQPNTGRYPACSVTLEVFHPPVVTIEAEGVFETGVDATFTCMATGNPSFFAYTWYYNDYQVSFEENPRFNRARLERSGSVLVLPDLSDNDNNVTLRCEAVNSLGATTERHVIRTKPGKTLAQIIGPILLGIIMGLVLVVLCMYAIWWRRQRRKVKQISKKKKSVKRTFSLRSRDDQVATVESGTVYKQTFGGFGSGRHGQNQGANGDLPRSGLDLESAGYGPDLTDTSSYRKTAEEEPEDDGALRPIPRKKSTTSLSSLANGGIHSATTSDDAALVSPVYDDKSFTYYVNPHFDERRNSTIKESKANDLNPPDYNITEDDPEKKLTNEDDEDENIISTEL